MTRIQIFLISLQTAQNRFVLLLMISFLQKLPKPRVFDDFDLENRYCDEIEQRERANVDFVTPVGNRPKLDPVEEEEGRAEEEDQGGGQEEELGGEEELVLVEAGAEGSGSGVGGCGGEVHEGGEEEEVGGVVRHLVLVVTFLKY